MCVVCVSILTGRHDGVGGHADGVVEHGVDVDVVLHARLQSLDGIGRGVPRQAHLQLDPSRTAGRVGHQVVRQHRRALPFQLDGTFRQPTYPQVEHRRHCGSACSNHRI